MSYIILLLITFHCTWADFNPNSLPVVVWWTKLLYPHPGGSTELSCAGGGRCMSTHRRRIPWTERTTAFLFYGTDFRGEDLPLPRRSNHVWAILHEESPLNNFILSHPEGMSLFNLSATFSRHSHFPLPTVHLPSLLYLTRRPPFSTRAKNELRKQGLAPILYLQSHCGVSSDRDRYMRRLMQFIQVDSYGECLRNKQLPLHLRNTDTHNSPMLMDFIARYKFHLAFENAICEDYVTEKLFRAFHVGSVPIYRGSSTVHDWAPSNFSVIVADDFPGPKELAEFINKLDTNDELYDAYLAYKVEGISNTFLKETLKDRTWIVNDPTNPEQVHDPTTLDFVQGFECYVCDQLCGKIPPPPPANQRHMNCPPPHPSLLPADLEALNEESRKENSCKLYDEDNNSCQVPLSKEPVMDEWSVEDWLKDYEFASHQAKAISLMVQNGEKDSSQFLHYLDKINLL